MSTPAGRLFDAGLAGLSADGAVDLIRRHGGSSVVFQTAAECLDHPQARALDLGETLVTGLPWRLEARGAHRVGSSGGGDPERPLAGTRVVDFGVGGVGPFSATLLGWLGADVVKVEAPNEFILAVRPTVAGLSSTYLSLNQGKRSVTLDLKQEPDRELAFALVDGADVVIENFRPGALARIGFGFDDLATRNPALVYCSATGFGWAGPLRDEPCTDPHMQAFSGFAAGNAGSDGLPRRMRYYAFVDLVTSAVIAEAVCNGLLVRATEGGPVHIETSMLHAAMEAQAAVREETDSPDGVFATADGHIALTCRSDDEWRDLVDLLPADPLLASDRFLRRSGRLTHSEELSSPRHGSRARTVRRLGAVARGARDSLLAGTPRRRGARPQGLLGSRPPPEPPGSRSPRPRCRRPSLAVRRPGSRSSRPDARRRHGCAPIEPGEVLAAALGRCVP